MARLRAIARFKSSSWCNLSCPSERTTIGCEGCVAGLSPQAARAAKSATGISLSIQATSHLYSQRALRQKGFLAALAAAAKPLGEGAGHRAVDQCNEDRIVTGDRPGH